jgi:hypothetical protein
MAYWLYCIACQQWSKSSTPMSDDKTCSFCGKKYTKIKKNEETIIADVEETQIATEIAETAEVTGETQAPAEPIENETVSPQETADEETEASETIEATEVNGQPETPEASEAAQDEPTEVVETEEPTVESEKLEAPKIKNASFRKSTAEKRGQTSKKR